MRVQAVGGGGAGGRSLAFGGQALNVLALKISIDFFLVFLILMIVSFPHCNDSKNSTPLPYSSSLRLLIYEVQTRPCTPN